MSNNEMFGSFRPKTPVPPRKPPAPSSWALVDEDLKKFIKKHEGAVRYLYKDTTDNVTIGYGQMIPTLEEARKLPLYKFEGERELYPASQDAIDNAWHRVRAFPSGQHVTAKHFDPTNSKNNLPNLGVRKHDMEFMLEATLRNNVVSLEKKLPEFNTYMRGPRKALIDMEFNIGPSKFNKENWPKLFDAVQRRDWKTAAKESHRYTLGLQSRNQEVERGFLEGLWEKY